MTDLAGTPASGAFRRCGAYASGSGAMIAHSWFSRTSWIAIAPGTVLITGDWIDWTVPSAKRTVRGTPSLRGSFSWKKGGLTGTPSMVVTPGALSSDGTRASR